MNPIAKFLKEMYFGFSYPETHMSKFETLLSLN